MISNLEGQRILVTGASGFIGAHLARRLCELNLKPTLWGRYFSLEQRANNRGAICVGFDLLNEAEAEAQFADCAPDIVFHLAGTRSTHSTDSIRLNVETTSRILELAQRHQTRRMIMVGSAAEYGRQIGPFSEDNPLQPCTVYGVSRAAATQLAMALYHTQNLPVVVLRLFTVYGPYQPRDMFVSEAIQNAIKQQDFTPRVPSHRQDLIFVDDVIEALLLASSAHSIEGKVFNIGSGVAPTLSQIIEQIELISKDQSYCLEEIFDVLNSPSAVIERAEHLLGWQPQTSLREGLKITLDWARNESFNRPH